MSLGEDFLEALRSVKRDLFRETEYANPDDQPKEEDADMAFGKNRRSGNDDKQELNRPSEQSVPEEAAAPAESGKDVMDAFQQAAVVSEELPVEDYSPEDDGEDSYVADTTPFRNYEPHEEEAAADGRRTNDPQYSEFYSDDQTVISKNTVIRGELQTTDSLRLLGEVWGDIECKSNIVVAGKVCGNTTAANAYIVDAQVDGDLMCDDSISVSDGSWILGNIRAQEAEIDGKIKGNIETRHAVSIGSSSSILGDISTDELEIKRGAFINGQIMMYSPSRDVMDQFDKLKK